MISWRRGELSSFELLVGKYQKRMLNIAFRITGNYEDACEVTLDAFIAAFRGIDAYRGEACFSTWLTSITLNLSLNRLQQVQAKGKNEVFSLDGPVHGEDHERPLAAPPALEQLELREIHERLKECIKALSVEFRETIVLRDLHNYSYDEICAILKIQEGEIKSRLFRAREMVRECLKTGGGKTVMEHADIRRKLSAYLDDAVSAEEKTEIKRHLGGCGSCRGAIADLDLTIGYIKSLPEVEPPPWLTTKIMARVLDTAAPKPGLWQRIFLPLHVKIPIEALALIFLCVTGYYHARMIGTHVPLTILYPLPRHVPIPPSVPESPVHMPHNKAGSPHPATFPPLEMAPSPITILPQSEAPPARPAEQISEPELRPADEDTVSEREGALPFARDEKGTHSAVKLAGKTPAVDAAPADKVEVALAVDDPASAAGAIEEAVARLGGRISGHSYDEENHLLLIQIEAQKIQELLARLGRIGTVQERPQLPAGARGTIDLSISW